MSRYCMANIGYATLREALASRNADELKTLARLFVKDKLTRKADCIIAIEKALAAAVCGGCGKIWMSYRKRQWRKWRMG